MKKLLLVTVCTTFILCLFLPGTPAYVNAASVQITLPNFNVTLNDARIDNTTRQYPLIVYKDITYFPMTYHDCRFLGLESNYTPQTGLDINKTGVAGNYNDNKISGRNPQRASAQTATFSIRVNGKTIDNSKEEYPLLLYKDITYFPLTWRFAADEFGWEYDFDSTYGLVISSTLPELPSPEQIADLISEANKKLRSDLVWLSATLRSYSRHANRVYGLINEYKPNQAETMKWYRIVEMTEADNGDNTANPKVTGHLFVDADGTLYVSNDGKKWTSKSSGDLPEIVAFEDITSQGFEDMMAALERLRQLPKEVFADARVGFFNGYLCLWLSFMDEEPISMPSVTPSGMTAGGIERHTFYFDMQERCLRSYYVSTVPFFLSDEGEIRPFAPSTTFYNVIDLDYKPFTMPQP